MSMHYLINNALVVLCERTKRSYFTVFQDLCLCMIKFLRHNKLSCS